MKNSGQHCERCGEALVIGWGFRELGLFAWPTQLRPSHYTKEINGKPHLLCFDCMIHLRYKAEKEVEAETELKRKEQIANWDVTFGGK